MINPINSAALSPSANSYFANSGTPRITAANNPVTAVERAAPAERRSYRPDLEKIRDMREEQRSYIEGLQGVTKQINYQLNGLSMSQNNADNLYNLAGMSRIKGLSGMQNYFSMFARDSNNSFKVDMSGVSPEVRDKLTAKAQEDVSENGYFGVAKTSDRIFNFAKALTGGDPSKMARMQKVVEKAFSDVAGTFGGLDKMPEISQKTYTAVMQKFNDSKTAAAANAKTTDLESTA